MKHYLNLVSERFNNLDSRTRLQLGLGIALLLFVAVTLSYANDQIATLVNKRNSRETDLVQMMTLKQRYLSSRVLTQKFSNRLAATLPDDSPAKIIEEIGIKGKTSLITPVKGETRGGLVEDAAEVKIEGLTANEAVNLLYRLEKGSRPVVIKRAKIKTRFDDPARLDLDLTVALIKGAATGRP